MPKEMKPITSDAQTRVSGGGPMLVGEIGGYVKNPQRTEQGNIE